MPINWTDDKDVFGRMFVLTNNSLFNQLSNAIDNEGADLSDALSWGQLKSKRWLVSELEKLDLELGTVFLCAGWYATLAPMLFDSNCKIDKIRSFDIDESCVSIADTINRTWVIDGWQFKASTLDIHDISYPTTHTTYRANGTSQTLIEEPDTIINTSCEHIKDFNVWYDKIPEGKMVILQSNDFFDVEEHINCVNSLTEFTEQTPMSTVLYQGELPLEKYTRYMRIGVK